MLNTILKHETFNGSIGKAPVTLIGIPVGTEFTLKDGDDTVYQKISRETPKNIKNVKTGEIIRVELLGTLVCPLRYNNI